MKMTDPEVLSRIESLIHTAKTLEKNAENDEVLEAGRCALKALIALADAVLQDKDVFRIEPWHPVHDDVPLTMPGEMLLRLKDRQGQALAPYPAIMAFYTNGLTAEIDAILFLCALAQFARSD